MTYCVPDHIAFCQVQGRTALLDIRRDRYFALPADLEGPFRQVASGDEDLAAPVLQRLVRLGLAAEGVRSLTLKPMAVRASHPEDAPFARNSTTAFFDVGKDLFKARHAVRYRPFPALIARLAARGERVQVLDKALLAATDRFLAVRSLIPIKPVCLQDSVALIDHLARRGFHPTLVFGVALAPFSAHCWVQVADVVLNDALLKVRAHTPILAV
ncbi:lasso peptide biosynthesis B2 protein [Caulobacter segnis]